ncbi:hypothetical protein OUZ56_014394 [Daphnia magna]|uniref:Alpha-1,4-N-acetylglucosaminyltransferase n=1 Tax=Daphnia magna TaxID=35525 RepID=A0ABR0AJM7_9CRUS|nr:hypothetical protein OUZ56_014394 [Daphnia magna]
MVQRSYRLTQAIIATAVAIILTCHLWLIAFPSGELTKAISQDQSKGHSAEHAVKIVQWRHGYLEAIDNRRIVMHETSGRGCLNARQSCAIESAARNNPTRPVQLFMRQPFEDSGSRSDAWLNVLRSYNNVEIIQLSDEMQYFNNTALFGWYMSAKWQQNGTQLSDYFRSVSLFRGGGLLLDLDSVVTIKPLNWMKWNNFFVVKRSDRNSLDGRVTAKMLHLIHGHHLIDEVILNMANMDSKEAPNGRRFGAAIEASVSRICGVNEPDEHFENRCLDVRFIDEEDVFLPSLNSSHWRRMRLAITSGTEDEMIKKSVEAHGAVLVTWDSMGYMKRNLRDSVYSSLLADHCPFTLAASINFPC